MKRLATIIALCLLGDAIRPQDLPSGAEVMRRVNERSLGAGSNMTLRLRLDDAQRGVHERLVELKRIRTKQGYRSRYRILHPEHLQGIDLLLIEEGPESAMWMYFPASDHLVKVASRGLSALASDFSCEDLRLTFSLDEYDFRNLGSAACGLSSCYQIEMAPRHERLKRELGFSRAVGWIDRESWNVLGAEYFDLQGHRFKTFSASPPQLVDEIQTIRSFEMRNHRVLHTSQVEVLEVLHNVVLDPKLFEPSGLLSRGAASSGKP